MADTLGKRRHGAWEHIFNIDLASRGLNTKKCPRPPIQLQLAISVYENPLTVFTKIARILYFFAFPVWGLLLLSYSRLPWQQLS